MGNITQSGILQTASSSSEGDIGKVYKFAADNSKVEWAVLSESKNDKYSIGTLGLDNFAPSATDLGVKPENIIKENHSHPMEINQKGEVESLDGDIGQSTQNRYPTNVYMPHSGNIYKVENGKVTLQSSNVINLWL